MADSETSQTTRTSQTGQDSQPGETRQGIGVSPGTAYGPVVQVAPPVRPPAHEPAVDDQDAALADVKAAFESVAVSLEYRATRVEDTAKKFLKATALIARD